MPCTKRRYPGKHAARVANSIVSFRLHIYYCDDCGAYHVSHAEKSAHDNYREENTWQNRKRGRERQQRGKTAD